MMQARNGDARPTIVVIVGPTGAGKTGIAIDLARRFNGEIVGADSMQIYRFMDIGTAKPTPAEQTAVTHHMIDIVDPDEAFDAAAYAAAAAEAIRDVRRRGWLPLVVGGTGLYIKALIHGLFDAMPSDPSIRRSLQRQAEADGAAALHRRLMAVDPAAAHRIHANDRYRIVRALEVFATSGTPLSDLQRHHRFQSTRYRALTMGASWPRPALYDRINRRVDRMLDLGFETEVRSLLERGYDRRLKSMQSLGYRHLAAYIDGEITREEAILTLKRDHRRYAKRQLTWFNRDPAVHWMAPDRPAAFVDRIRRFLA